MTLTQYYEQQAARLSDEALSRELLCARQTALRCTRTRRDLALMRLRCLDCELARRAMTSGRNVSGAELVDGRIRPFPVRN